MSRILALDETFKSGMSALSFADNGPALPLDAAQPVVVTTPAIKPEFTPS